MDEVAAPILVVVVAVYSLARWVPDLRGLVGLASIALNILGDYLFRDLRDNGTRGRDRSCWPCSARPSHSAGSPGSWRVQAEQLGAQQELIRDQAVREERDRIARELHDVIAHSVSAMVVQTAAARDRLRGDPDGAERILDTVTDTGRRALDETGRLLHVLRDSDDELGLAPTPGLRDLDALVEGFRAAGLRVDVVVEGEAADLPAALDTSSYRVVQEALTNALRYAADGAVELQVRVARDGVTIRSSNVARVQPAGAGQRPRAGRADRTGQPARGTAHPWADPGRAVRARGRAADQAGGLSDGVPTPCGWWWPTTRT